MKQRKLQESGKSFQCCDKTISRDHNSLAVGLTLLYSHMVSVVACHAGDPGSNPVGPKVFFSKESQ